MEPRSGKPDAGRRFDIRRENRNNGGVRLVRPGPETCMRYEHLIEINDPRLPLLPLTREQLWRGLVLRAYFPQQFIFGLDNAVTGELASDDASKVLERTLDYGSFTVRDIVRLYEFESICTDVEAGPAWPQSRLVIAIEEPAAGRLYLRFIYEWDQTTAESELDQVTLSIRQQAYHASDLDTVARLRELADEHRGQG